MLRIWRGQQVFAEELWDCILNLSEGKNNGFIFAVTVAATVLKEALSLFSFKTWQKLILILLKSTASLKHHFFVVRGFYSQIITSTLHYLFLRPPWAPWGLWVFRKVNCIGGRSHEFGRNLIEMWIVRLGFLEGYSHHACIGNYRNRRKCHPPRGAGSDEESKGLLIVKVRQRGMKSSSWFCCSLPKRIHVVKC